MSRINKSLSRDNTNEKARQLYLDWLCDTVLGSDKNRRGLLLYLMEEPFIALVKYDSGKQKDALYLREQFYKYAGKDASDGLDELEPSVLEVLAVLSVNASELLDGLVPKKNNDPELYFWTFIDNLGLLSAWTLDGRFDSSQRKRAEKIVRKWLRREYGNDGKGSIFPGDYVSIRPKVELPKCDVWHQLNFWCQIIVKEL